MHISLHGLIRGEAPEIGRDADTGGQVRYVLDLVQSLGRRPEVRRVDLMTRRIVDAKLSSDYQRAFESLGDKAAIYRLDCGPKRYLRKESLWPHLQAYIDHLLRFIRQQDDVPDYLHAHYADAGLVAVRVAKVLGIPVIFTGHSLGRAKQKKLLAGGMAPERAEKLFSFAQRIEAEEETLENASLVITSTKDEAESQYAPYDHYNQRSMNIIPPGCGIERFAEPPEAAVMQRVRDATGMFLRHPERPALVVLARPDRQKNVPAALHLFGRTSLRERCNLILYVGNRGDLRELEPEQRQLYTALLLLIDHYDLHGLVALPKTHWQEDVPALFAQVAQGGGALLHLARYENFGITLVEAAAAGLPAVSCATGGSADVIEACNHGAVVPQGDLRAMEQAITALLDDKDHWRQCAENGRKAASELYSWDSHINAYLAALERIAADTSPAAMPYRPKRFVRARMMLVSDIDDTLTGDAAAIERLNRIIQRREDLLFGVATGRNLEAARATLREWHIAEPDFYITSVGTAIHYNMHGLVADRHWLQHIQFRWRPERIARLLDGLPGLTRQPPEDNTPHKISYFMGAGAPDAKEIKQLLRQNLLQARVVISRGLCLDILPVRASKGHALRHLAWKWQFDASQVITAGDAGNDLDMLRGNTRGIVVANHTDEVEELREEADVYFSPFASAEGVIDGLRYWGMAEIANDDHPPEEVDAPIAAAR